MVADVVGSVGCRSDGGDVRGDLDSGSTQFFKIVDLEPSRKRTLGHWVGGGRRLESCHLAVALHEGIIRGDTCILAQSGTFARVEDPISILGLSTVDPFQLESQLKQWRVSGLRVSLPPLLDGPGGHGGPVVDVSEELTRLVERACFGPETAAYPATPSRSLLAMESAGFLTKCSQVG